VQASKQAHSSARRRPRAHPEQLYAALQPLTLNAGWGGGGAPGARGGGGPVRGEGAKKSSLKPTAQRPVPWRPGRGRRARTIGAVSSAANPSVPPSQSRTSSEVRCAAAGACRDVQSPAGPLPDSPRADSRGVRAEGRVRSTWPGLRFPGTGGGLQGHGDGGEMVGLGAILWKGLASGHLVRAFRLRARDAVAERQARGRHWPVQPFRGW